MISFNTYIDDAAKQKAIKASNSLTLCHNKETLVAKNAGNNKKTFLLHSFGLINLITSTICTCSKNKPKEDKT
jgi:hypothetical protein